MKFVHIFFIIYVSNCYSFDIERDDGWNNLLHFESSRNNVISPDWLYSDEKTAKSELKNYLEILKSKKPDPIICEFPARFLYLLTKYAIDISNYFDNCNDLTIFSKSLEKKYISLTITSEYYNAPSSAFGHIMLLFHDKEIPELDSTVIHFSALAKDDGFIQYTMNGLTGNYSGFFFMEPFYKKYNEYSNIEQRYIFIHPLKLTKNQRKILIYHLYELQRARFEYYFLTENCGYQINKLIKIATQKKIKAPNFYFLPSEVLIDNATILEPAIVLPPLSTRSSKSINALSKDDHAKFSRIIYNEKGKPIIDNNLSNNLKKALVLYAQYQFRKKKNVLSSYSDIQSLSVVDLDVIENNDKKIDSPAIKPPARRLSIGTFQTKKNQSPTITLGLRPLLVDLNDFQNHNLHESSFNILSTEVKFEKSKLYLQRFDIFDLKLISITDQFFANPSWFLNTGLNRENVNEDLAFSNSFGVGQSVDLYFTSSYFIGATVDIVKLKKILPAILSTFNLVRYFGETQKFLYDGKLKIYSDNTYYSHDFSFKKKLFYINLSLGLIYSNDFTKYVKLDYYF